MPIKREFLSKSIGKAVERALDDRSTIILNDIKNSDDESIHVIQNDDREYTIKSQVIAPIVTQGDPIGAVVIVSKEDNTKLGDMEVKLAETAAGF